MRYRKLRGAILQAGHKHSDIFVYFPYHGTEENNQ